MRLPIWLRLAVCCLLLSTDEHVYKRSMMASIHVRVCGQRLGMSELNYKIKPPTIAARATQEEVYSYVCVCILCTLCVYIHV